MKLSLYENISKLRKECFMTQEQLAEALGVTFAAVSKWERGMATPELNLIAQMAGLFQVSLDALVGFEVQNGNAVALAERIHELQRQKKYDVGISETEKALLRYPNDFRVVYRSAELYAFAGLEQKNEKYLKRCIELYERSILLVSQNNDPEISDVSIQNEIAHCYIVLGECEKGLEILKRYNIDGAHDALIAMTYMGNQNFEPKDAEPYMMGAVGHLITSAFRTMMAYANYYVKLEDFVSSRESLTWLVEMLQAIKCEANAVAYVDKVIAPCYSECAKLSCLLGEKEKAEQYLRCAYHIAKAFDDFGDSVIVAVEKQIAQENQEEELISIWKKDVAEESSRDR